MMKLKTVAKAIDNKKALVFWKLGQKGGIFNVSLPNETEESAIIAELSAIQHLLYQEQVFDRYPSAGQGYELVVSSGAIKKLALGRSSKIEPRKYATFLRTKFSGAKLRVSHSLENMPTEAVYPPEPLFANPTLFASKLDLVDTPALGVVHLTYHAVEQYQKRCPDPMKDPRRSLVKRLRNPNLERQPIPPKVMQHKLKKYGKNDNIEAWSHSETRYVYLVLTENNRRSLVTVFEPYTTLQK